MGKEDLLMILAVVVLFVMMFYGMSIQMMTSLAG
jgi:hypothetical protein